MKAILKYDLPEDETEFQWAMQSRGMYAVIWEMDQWLRSNIKYAPDNMSEDTYKAYESAREYLHQLINENNIIFE